MTKFIFIVFIFISSFVFAQGGNYSGKIYFEENKGQVYSVGNTSQINSGNIWFVLKSNLLTYYFSDRGYSVVQINKNGVGNRTDFLFHHERVCFVPGYTEIIPEGENEIHTNKKYYLPGKIISPQAFEKIIYHNVWRGVDLAFSLHGDSLERKIIINDPGFVDQNLLRGEIEFDMSGSSFENFSDRKGISFTSDAGTFTEKLVSDNSNLRAGTLPSWEYEFPQPGYEIGKANSNDNIAAASTISWLTYIGGNSADEFFGIQVTNDSGAVVVGRTGSLDFPATVGAQQDTMAGNYDAVVARFSSNGNCMWSTYFGGTNFDGAWQVAAIDSFFVVCGMTNSTDLPVINATQNFNAGSYDAFLLVMDSAGNELRSTYYGGTGGDQGICVAKGPANEIVLAGSSSSVDLPLANSGYQSTLGGQIDAFLSVFDLNLSAQWSTYYGGTMAEDIHGICVTPQGEIAFVGGTRSNNFPVTANAWQNGMLGAPDNYLVKFGMDGTRHYGTFFGGTNNEDANGIVSDAIGNLYMTGFTYSADFPTQGIIFQPNILGQNDVYVSKFDTAGQLVWSTFVGGGGQDVGWGIYCSGKYIYICGETASNTFPVSPNAIQNTWDAISDGFVIKMDTAGQMVSGTFMGGNGYDGLLALTVTADTSVIATGDTYSSDLPATANAFQMTNHSNGDGYVVKFGMAEQSVSMNIISTTQNSGINVFPNPSNDFVTVSSGEIISAIEISDVTGRRLGYFSENSSEIKMDFSNLPIGIYFLKVASSDSKIQIFRVVKS